METFFILFLLIFLAFIVRNVLAILYMRSEDYRIEQRFRNWVP